MGFIEVSGKRYDTGLVIFDKDGTLLDFEKTWVNIIRELIAVLCSRSGAGTELKNRIQLALGVFIEKGEIDGAGVFAMGTSFEVDTLLTYCLYREGLRWDKAQELAKEVTTEIFNGSVREHNLHASSGAIDLLKTLKARGMLTAVATNDNLQDATRDMEVIGARPYLDLIIGADMVENTKPAPDMIYLIGERLKQDPKRAVMIGDTMMDVLMGKNAGVMLNIGIYGIVPRETLAEGTDVLIASLEEIT